MRSGANGGNLRAVGRIGCMRGRLDRLVKQMDAEQEPEKKKRFARQRVLPVRLAMARQWEKLITLQLAVTDTPGALGSIANLEQHVRRQNHLLDAHDEKLSSALGGDLPKEVHPAGRYFGTPRLIVPTRRSRAAAGEQLNLRVIVLDNDRPQSATLRWRPMGRGEFQKINLTHVARGVYTATLPPAEGEAIEYYVEATTADGTALRWPATAPEICRTVVVTTK